MLCNSRITFFIEKSNSIGTFLHIPIAFHNNQIVIFRRFLQKCMIYQLPHDVIIQLTSLVNQYLRYCGKIISFIFRQGWKIVKKYQLPLKLNWKWVPTFDYIIWYSVIFHTHQREVQMTFHCFYYMGHICLILNF